MKRLLLCLVAMLYLSASASAQTTPTIQNCIAIMGDSLPAGTFVAQIPGTGVTVMQARQMSMILDDALQARDLIHYGVYDLSLAASSISAENYEPYLTSREYFLGRSLNCRYVLVFPFLNDLYASDDGGDIGRSIYTQAMNTMIEGIRTNSPDSNIILMNFYHTTLQGAGDRTYGGNVTFAHVAALNLAHEALCTVDMRVYCLPLNQILSPINNYVVGNISQADYDIFGFSLINEIDQPMLDNYWLNQPTSVVYGDGLHLNPTGQVVVIGTLMAMFAQIDPINFAPIF